MKALKIFILCVLFGFVTNLFAQDSRRDGNWWGTQTRASKIDYLVGFFDGMDLGANFAKWGFGNFEKAQGKKADLQALSAATESYGKYSQKYFLNVTSGQLADGLDSFYGDYKNRRIRIHTAVWLVVQSIAGEPPTEAVLNNWRKSDAP